MGNSESSAEQRETVASLKALTSTPGAFNVPGNPCQRSNQQFIVEVPAGATPGYDFPVLAGGYQLMVRCPFDVKPGDRIVVRAPNCRNTDTYSALVPNGVQPGDQFLSLIDGKPHLVTCPPGVGEGMAINILVAKSNPQDAGAPFGKTKFRVTIPSSVHPGESFALLAGTQKVILVCPQNASPGDEVEFLVPISILGEEYRTTVLKYEKQGCHRCLSTDLTFQWGNQPAHGAVAPNEASGDDSRGASPETLAFVCQLSSNSKAKLGFSIELVPVAEARSSALVEGRTNIALDLAKYVTSPFQTKEAWFRGKVSKLQIPWEEGHVRINVQRANLLVDAMEAFESIKKEDMRKTFRFEFIGEPGIDAGGVSREFYQLVSNSLFNPEVGLFSYSGMNQSCCQINPCSGDVNEEHLRLFHFCGRFLAKALFDRQIVNGHLVQSLYKFMLSWPVSMGDLQALDPEVYHNLTKLLDLDDVSILELDFTCSANVMGQTKVQELKPGGAECTVTKENLGEYLQLQCKHRLFSRVQEQVKHLLVGFYDVIDAPLLIVFDFAELELLLCGMPQINVLDWQANTEYLGAYEELGQRHVVVKMFWDVVENEFSSEQRARLLQFVTGTAGVPAAGFAYLQGNDGNCRKFAVNSISMTQSVFPKAHTCFNRIDLPVYESKEDLTKFLSMAVQMHATGFDTE